MKRKLSEQQNSRIKKNQKERIESSEFSLEEPGQIIAHYGQTLEVLNSEGKITYCFARQNLGPLVTGDQILFRQNIDPKETGIITACLPRKSLLERPDHYKVQKTIAANMDQIFIIISTNPEPIELNLDKALVMAENQNLEAVLILNKIDLLTEKNSNYFENLLSRYQKIGYPIFKISTLLNQGLDNLRLKILNKTSIFIGQSGVGKSSLINLLFDNALLAKTGEISDANQKGKHTTTTARLYKNSEGAELIDSPGVREFGIWNLSPEELLQGFIEFKPFLNQCKFRNCSHQNNTQDCALQKALQEGLISHERMQSYLRLFTEVK